MCASAADIHAKALNVSSSDAPKFVDKNEPAVALALLSRSRNSQQECPLMTQSGHSIVLMIGKREQLRRAQGRLFIGFSAELMWINASTQKI
jgi:hypothetical protein